MKHRGAEDNTPLVLLINDEEWTARSLESILRPEGYAVLTADSGAQGLQLAEKVRPDLLLVDMRLPDLTGIDLVARLRKLPTVRASTPIVLFSSGPIRRADELAALQAGAWATLTPPFDPQELLARIRPFVSAKRETDEALDSALLDPTTGFYNVRGLLKRVKEISADMSRSKRPLACIMLGPSAEKLQRRAGPDQEQSSSEAAEGEESPPAGFEDVLLSSTRLSDVVGRVGQSDFVIVAPGTDRDGAMRLAQRLMEAAASSASEALDLPLSDLRAGFYSISAEEPDSVVPEEFLRRATAALREAQSETGSGEQNRIRQFKTN